jgi:transaldolase
MFSSVRNIEHIRDAIVIGADACTIPWKLMSTMADNHLTELHTEQFFKDTRMLKITASDSFLD